MARADDDADADTASPLSSLRATMASAYLLLGQVADRRLQAYRLSLPYHAAADARPDALLLSARRHAARAGAQPATVKVTKTVGDGAEGTGQRGEGDGRAGEEWRNRRWSIRTRSLDTLQRALDVLTQAVLLLDRLDCSALTRGQVSPLLPLPMPAAMPDQAPVPVPVLPPLPASHMAARALARQMLANHRYREPHPH